MTCHILAVDKGTRKATPLPLIACFFSDSSIDNGARSKATPLPPLLACLLSGSSTDNSAEGRPHCFHYF